MHTALTSKSLLAFSPVSTADSFLLKKISDNHSPQKKINDSFCLVLKL
jgi:hypothetical protein